MKAMEMMMKVKQSGRRNPFNRTVKPSPIVLQARDEEIIKAVYEYGVLTGEQIERLFGFGCATRRNVRLRSLFDHRFLERKFLPTLQGSAKALYVLGPLGVPVVSSRLGVDPQEVKLRMKRAREIKEMFLRHRLQVNEFRIAFSLAAARTPGARFDRWHAEPEISETTIIPDAYCEYAWDEKRWSFFLELDRSTESHRRFKAKVDAYLKYGFSGKYQREFGLKFFRVLVVTESDARRANLKKLVEGITDKMFWVAVISDLTPNSMFNTVWQRPGKESLFTLMEIH